MQLRNIWKRSYVGRTYLPDMNIIYKRAIKINI